MATRQRPKPPTRPTISGLAPADAAPGREHLTIGQFIVEQIKAGVDPVNAAGAAGVLPAEFTAWMRDGARAYNRVTSGADWYKDLTPAEQDAVVFADQVVRARSTHIAALTVIAEQGARGGLQRRRTVTKRVNGQVAEVVETIETTLPDLDMVKWKLERLEPTVYGSKATLNLTVSDLTDTAETADVVSRRMEEIALALADVPAIETTGTEIEPGSSTP